MMSTPASDTPLKELIEHAAAFSSKDNQRFAENLSLPFIHLSPDGEVWQYKDPGDVDLFKQYAKARIDAENFGRTELDEANLILDWDDLTAFHTKFTRYTRGGEKIGQAEAIWVAIREGTGWKVKLRIGAVQIK
jgi:hypothetical protein